MWTINPDKYIIYEAENGKHRIENVQQLRPKLIIRNIMMTFKWLSV
jgi:YesN/AraC family two-component response regulator